MPNKPTFRGPALRLSSEVHNWDQLPIFLNTAHMMAVYQVSGKTISRWARSGQVPPPTIISGNVRRWDRDQVREHVTRLRKFR